MGLVVDMMVARIPDELWARIQPLILQRKPHPLGSIARGWTTEAPWTRFSCVAHRLSVGSPLRHRDLLQEQRPRRFQEWTQAGVFRNLSKIAACSPTTKLFRDRMEMAALDAAMTKATSGGEKPVPIAQAGTAGRESETH